MRPEQVHSSDLPIAVSFLSELKVYRAKLNHVIGGILQDKQLAFSHQSISTKLDEWNKVLDQIENDAKIKPEVAISVVGGTGTGKSTLLNALLGVRLLPTSTMEACTAAISEIRFASTNDFSVEITFISRKEWLAELNLIRTEIKDIERHKNDAEIGQGNPETKAAWNKINAVYGEKSAIVAGKSSTANADIDNLVEPTEIKDALDSGTLHFTVPDLETLGRRIHTFLSSQERFWAIVKRVKISGPFESLRCGAAIIDLPGINDPNAAREEVTRNYIKTSQFIWVVFNMKRILTRDAMQLMESDEFRQIIMDGKTDALSFIGTCSDDVDFDTAWKELGLAENATDDDIISKRDQKVRHKVAAQLDELTAQLARNADAPEQAAIINKTFRKAEVFTVSAKDFLAFKTRSRRNTVLSSEEATNIPLLQFHMEQMCSDFDPSAHYHKHFKQLRGLQQSVTQDLQERSFGAKQAAKIGKAERERRVTAAKERLTFLKNAADEITSSFAEDIVGRQITLTQSIERGVERAQESMGTVINRWQNMHWATLRAVVRRGGRYHGSTGVHDFALDLSRPILDKITFVWSDFFGNALQQCLNLWTGRLEEEARSYYDVLLSIAEADSKTTDAFRKSLDVLLHDETSRLRSQMDAYILQDQKSLYDKLPDEIREEMSSAFTEAMQEQGLGMKSRMVTILKRHADLVSVEMFSRAQATLTNGIQEMSSSLQKDFSAMSKKLQATATSSQRKILAQDLSEEDIRRAEITHGMLVAVLEDLRLSTTANHK